MVTWGLEDCGGNFAALRDVAQNYSTECVWCSIESRVCGVLGSQDRGRNSRSAQAAFRAADTIYSTHDAFATVLKAGIVMTWGHKDYADNSRSVRQL